MLISPQHSSRSNANAENVDSTLSDSEYKEDGWYSDGGDEVFVLDFVDNPLDPESTIVYDDSEFFGFGDEGYDTQLLENPLGTFDNGFFNEPRKDADPSASQPQFHDNFLALTSGKLSKRSHMDSGRNEEGVDHSLYFQKRLKSGTDSLDSQTSARGSVEAASKSGASAKQAPRVSSNCPPSRSSDEPRTQACFENTALLKSYSSTFQTHTSRDSEYSRSVIRAKSGNSGHLVVPSTWQGPVNDVESNMKHKRTSKFRGVSCCGKDRKWQARIRESNKVRYLGRFQTEVEAAVVYDEASRQCKGESAPTNFVRMDTETMLRLQEAYEKFGTIPPSMYHLLANPRKTKLKKRGEKKAEVFAKQTDSNNLNKRGITSPQPLHFDNQAPQTFER